MSKSVAALIVSITILALAACAPRSDVATGVGPVGELERTAQIAFHRMQVAYLETGGYTTNALIDLDLPRGVKWTLEEFDEDGYRLRFTDDNRPGVALLVTPAGIRRAQAGGG